MAGRAETGYNKRISVPVLQKCASSTEAEAYMSLKNKRIMYGLAMANVIIWTLSLVVIPSLNDGFPAQHRVNKQLTAGFYYAPANVEADRFTPTGRQR